jgi:hypothetical protein
MVLVRATAANADEPTPPKPDTESAPNPELLAIPDNSWLNLNPKGIAFARMYSGCCAGAGYVWYFGGAHRSYKGNDVQLFDPRVNAWIQATKPEWPEVGSPDWKSMVSGGGSTSRLSPLGHPYTEHTYQQVCWQPDREKFFIVLVSSGTWEFDPSRRKWIHLINRFNDKSEPRGTWAQNHVLYEPALKAPVLFCGSKTQGIYKFDHTGRKWQPLHDLPDGLAWNEFYSTHVPEWKQHLISTMKRGFFQLDVVKGKLTPIESPEAISGCQSLSYDSANHVVVALARKSLTDRKATVIPWVLDVKTMKWTELTPPQPWPEGQATGRWTKLWYDALHNVHILVNDVRRDREELFDGGVTETWAYRYKRVEDNPSK